MNLMSEKAVTVFNFNYMRYHFAAFVLSTLLLLGAIFLLTSRGLNLGIDFSGGTLIEIKADNASESLSDLRTDLNALGLGNISIQTFGDPDDLLIRMPQQSGGPESQEQAILQVRQVIDRNFESQSVDYRRIEYVGPQVGKELQEKGIMAAVLALGGIMIYIAFRFEWRFGVAGIVALFHDMLLTLGLFSLMRWQFDLSTLAAVLMIAGYSINDTVVIFDRVRENLRKYKKMPLYELLNQTLNQTMSRTIVTTGTTLLALLALWLVGGEVIRGFVNALFFGIVIGTYSTIFVATPILLYMKIRRIQKTEAEKSEKEVKI